MALVYQSYAFRELGVSLKHLNAVLVESLERYEQYWSCSAKETNRVGLKLEKRGLVKVAQVVQL